MKFNVALISVALCLFTVSACNKQAKKVSKNKNYIEAVDDVVATQRNKMLIINDVRKNDINRNNSEIELTKWTEPSIGELNYIGNGVFEFKPGNEASQETNFQYTIINQFAEESSATVTIKINTDWNFPQSIIEAYDSGLQFQDQANAPHVLWRKKESGYLYHKTYDLQLGQWQSPVNIGKNSPVEEFKYGINQNGIHLLFTQAEQENTTVWYSFRANNSAWNTPIEIDDVVATKKSLKNLNIDKDGNIMALWEATNQALNTAGNQLTTSVLWYNYFSVTGNIWLGTSSIDDNTSPGFNLFPKLHPDNAGNYLLFFGKTIASNRGQFFNYFEKTTQQWMGNASFANNSANIDIVLHQSGNVFHYWHDGIHMTAAVFDRQTKNWTYSTVDDESLNDSGFFHSFQFVDPQGNVIVAWEQNQASDNQYRGYYRRYFFGDEQNNPYWGPIEAVEPLVNGSNYSFRLVNNKDNSIAYMFVDIQRLMPAGGWESDFFVHSIGLDGVISEKQPIINPLKKNVNLISLHKVLEDDDGNLIAIWQHNTESGLKELYYARKPKSFAWQTGVQLQADNLNSNFIATFIQGGMVWILWTQKTPENTEYVAARSINSEGQLSDVINLFPNEKYMLILNIFTKDDSTTIFRSTDGRGLKISTFNNQGDLPNQYIVPAVETPSRKFNFFDIGTAQPLIIGTNVTRGRFSKNVNVFYLDYQ